MWAAAVAFEFVDAATADAVAEGTVRGSIVSAAVAALANAAAFTANGAVELTQEMPAWESLDDGPVVIVSDPDSEQAQNAYGGHTYPLTVRAEIVAQAGTTPESLRGYAAAALAALGGSAALAALVVDMRPGAVRINPGAPEDTVATAVVELAVTYEASMWGL